MDYYNSQWPANTSDMPQDIANAMDYIRDAIPLAQKDASRPKYHFVPPAGAMIDTWGAILHKGYYHLFYDINTDGKKERFVGSFGHIRSKDMIHWEQLPIALTPSEKKGELRCNDGCVVMDPSGRALMYYTSVFYDDEKKHREHTPVRGDDDLIAWKRIEKAAPITIKNHNDPFYKTGWSDPFIFNCQGRTFMLLSKCVTADGKNQIPIYEAADDTWLNWEFRGIFFDDSGEVINFIKIDDRWVLIYCPYQNPVYFVGGFDINSYRFVPQNKDILSYGYVSQGDEDGGISRGLYATSVLKTADGRSVIFGWVSGFYAPGGWDGCVSLPRQLSLGADNKVRMVPADEVNLLRKHSYPLKKDCPLHCGNTFELVCDISFEEDGEAIISANGDTLIQIKDQTIMLNDITIPCADKNINIRLFVDVSLAELFINNGDLSITRCIKPIREDSELLIKGKNYSIANSTIHELTI